MDILQQISDVTKKRVKVVQAIAKIEAQVKDSLAPLKEKKAAYDLQAHPIRAEEDRTGRGHVVREER